jgi:hypothetical protein
MESTKYSAKIHRDEPTFWTVVDGAGLPYSFWETKAQATKAARQMSKGRRPSYKAPGFKGESEIMETYFEEAA